MIGICICDICGTQSVDHAGWFAIAGAGSRMEVLPWSDELRGQADYRHACSPEHAQKIVFSAASHELARPLLALPVQHGGWNPASLIVPKPPVCEVNDLESLLSTVDAILHGPTADEDEEAAFDA